MADVKITELPEIAEVSGTDVLPIVDVSGSVTSKVTFTDLRTAVLDGVSADKIQDAAGTTRVETEEETGRVIATADGHRALDVGSEAIHARTEDVDAGGGTTGRAILDIGAFVPEAPNVVGARVGLVVDYPIGEVTAEYFSGVVSRVEGASLRAMFSLPGGAQLFGTAIDAGQDDISFARVSTENPEGPSTSESVRMWDGASTGELPAGMSSIVHGFHVLDARVPMKIERGNSRIEIESDGSIAIYRGSGNRVAYFSSPGSGNLSLGGSWGASIQIPEASNSHISMRSGGWDHPLTAAGYTQLPTGIASVMQGLHAGKSALDTVDASAPQPWTPSWSGTLNVDSASHVEASVQEIGDYIDVEGKLTVTPDAAGLTVATTSIGVAFAHPAVNKDGQASAGVPGVAVQSAGCGVFTAGTLSVAFDAASNAEHDVSFRVRYRKAAP